ncbi:glutathione S-transferase [Xylaria arbuscula]|nr:glutathione S-transferase [Xylaria arbuscula]
MATNPAKPIRAVWLFEELGLNYEIKSFRFDDVKKPPFIDINPNGRLPAIEDPAIYQYLIEVYDTEKRLSYESLNERHFHLHPEKIPSAIERYENEVRRVLGVLEAVLSKNPADAQWLVGDKMTFADMSFMPWNFRLSEITPHVRAWHGRMVALPSWTRCMETRARLMDEQGLQWNGVPKGIETFTDYEAKIAAGEDTTAKG